MVSLKSSGLMPWTMTRTRPKLLLLGRRLGRNVANRTDSSELVNFLVQSRILQLEVVKVVRSRNLRQRRLVVESPERLTSARLKILTMNHRPSESVADLVAQRLRHQTVTVSAVSIETLSRTACEMFTMP
jgi:hypothetical protein